MGKWEWEVYLFWEPDLWNKESRKCTDCIYKEERRGEGGGERKQGFDKCWRPPMGAPTPPPLDLLF